MPSLPRYFTRKPAIVAALLALTTSVAFAEEDSDLDPEQRREVCAAVGCDMGRHWCGTVSGERWEVLWVLEVPIPWKGSYYFNCYERSLQ